MRRGPTDSLVTTADVASGGILVVLLLIAHDDNVGFLLL